jgi:DNA invertase Pin-like site-specific DNA recombinase
VSTTKQDAGTQRAALERAGVPPRDIIERELSSVSEQWREERDAILADLKSGDTLTVWKFDRLGRSLADLVAVIDDLIARGVNVVSLTEAMDLSTAGGRLAFHVLASAAEFERELVKERTAATLRVRIEAGMVVRGPRLYGFADDGVSHVEHECVTIREIVRRVQADESIHGIVDDLNQRKIPTATGGTWARYGLRELLRNPRLAGLHSYKGKVLGPGSWEPIISVEEHEEMKARLPRYKGRGIGGGRPISDRYPYSGVLTCGVCHVGRMIGNSRGAARRYYGCGNPACHRTTISAPMLERDLNIAVLPKLLDPAFVERIAQAVGGDPALSARLADERQKLVRLARQFGEDKFSEEEWQAMRQPIDRRVRAMEEEQANQPNQALMTALLSFRAKYGHLTLDQLEELEDEGEQIDTPMSVWLSWSPKLRRQVLRLIIDRGVIQPGARQRTTRGTPETRVSVTFK